MSLRNLIIKLNQEIGISDSENLGLISNEIILARKVLNKLNEYFFQTYGDIGFVHLNDRDYQYFSEFHKFWEMHHAEIINAKYNLKQAAFAAKALHEATIAFSNNIFNITLDTHGLSKQAIAKVRFFTANQDFRVPPEDQFQKYLDDDSQFEIDNILSNPAGFLNFMGFSRLSQNDKRIDYAKKAAQFLHDREISPFQIAEYFNYDAKNIRNAFLDNIGMGYGNKKTDMFIRDMVVQNVWPNIGNIDTVNVASDRNTMKLALRTQILQTDMPLLSSFLDIFGYQYSYIDTMSALSWREVWKIWKIDYPSTAPSAPCMMDFLLYRIGKEYCNDKLVEFICENGHKFYYFGAQKKICRFCDGHITPLDHFLPCQLIPSDLPRDENNNLMIKESNLLRTFDGKCIFESTCQPKNEGFLKLSPPKSISIMGQTGWTESYANRDEGGGGMMG